MSGAENILAPSYVYYFSTLCGEKTIADLVVVNISEARNPLAVSPELQNITVSLASLTFTYLGVQNNNKDCYQQAKIPEFL